MTTMMMTSKIDLEAYVGNDDVDGGINVEIAERIPQPSPSSCRIGIAGRHTTIPYHTIPCYRGVSILWYCHAMLLPYHSIPIYVIPYTTSTL